MEKTVFQENVLNRKNENPHRMTLRKDTRNAFIKTETDYSKFEKTINIILSQLSLIDDVQFDLRTCKKQIDPISKSK